MSKQNNDTAHLKLKYDERSKQQWAILDSLAERYKDVDMSSISRSSNFFDDTWNTDSVSFRFEKELPSDTHYPLQFVIRIACYYSITIQGKKISTIYGSCLGFIKRFKSLLSEGAYPILIAKRDEPFATLSSLEPEMITQMVQDRIATQEGLSGNALHFIQSIVNIPYDAGISVFTHGVLLPWHQDKLLVIDWIEQQKKTSRLEYHERFYAPLPFETVSNIVNHANLYITDYYKIVTDFFHAYKDVLSRQSKKSGSGNVHSSKQLNDFINQHQDTLNEILPLTYTDLYEYKNEKKVISRTIISAGWIKNLMLLVQSAASWIILLTTGLRNIDMRNLRIGCCKKSKRLKNVWWLVTDIQKTNKKGWVLPVPENTAKAVFLLENARLNWKSPALIINSSLSKKRYKTGIDIPTQNFGFIMDGDVFNKRLKILAKRYEFNLPTTLESSDKEATSHCVRVTLASYIAQNSNMAILILKRLFGHSNALMPNEYIRRNPLVIKRRKKMLDKLNEELAGDLAEAVSNGEVAGKKGEMLLKGAQHIKSEIRIENNSLTEMDILLELKERLKLLYLSDIKNQEVYALLTPMAVVCMRTCNNISDTPCSALANHQKRVKKGIKKAITDALGILPNPAQCVGSSCPDALLGKKWSRELLKTFEYYAYYHKSIAPNSVIEEDAKIFVRQYAPLLKQIYANEQNEGYFDVD